MIIDTDEKRQLRAKELQEEQERDELEREQAKKNRNFVQFYRNHMSEFRWLMDLNPLAAKILIFIMEHMDNRNALVCSYTSFAEALDVSISTITRAIRILKENGFLSILKIGTSNVYILNHEVAWSSWENQKKYSLFDGKVLVNHKENKDYNANLKSQRFKAIRDTAYFKRQQAVAKKYGLRGAEDDGDND